MKAKMKQLLMATMLTLFVADANAGCWLDGIEYPEGTIKDNMVCGNDGYWRPQ